MRSVAELLPALPVPLRGGRAAPTPASVNLLSPAMLEHLAVTRIRKRFLGGALALAVLIDAGWTVQTQRLHAAHQQLAAEAAPTPALTAQLRALEPVAGFFAQVAHRKQTAAAAMAAEVLFSTALSLDPRIQAKPVARGAVMQPHEMIWTLTNAVVVSRALHVVAELGVADEVDAAPVAVERLAEACGAHPVALGRVLRLLSSQGVFSVEGDVCAHTQASRLLRSDHPMSMRAFARLMGLPGFVAIFDQLGHSVRTGEPAAALVHPDGVWGLLAEHPDQAEVFGQAMTAKAAADIAAVLDAYDFSPFSTVADIGGGRGHLLRAILDAVPHLAGALFDRPPVVEMLAVDTDRLVPCGGDFFVDPLPSADLYVLMEVIHDWADPEAAAVLQAVRNAAARGARVLIVENVLAEAPDPRGYILDVIMLVVTGGRERTVSELRRLLNDTGFSDVQVYKTSGPLSVVEGIAV